MRGLFKPTVVVHAQCKLYTKILKKNNHTTFLCWYKCVFNHYERLRGFYNFTASPPVTRWSYLALKSIFIYF